MPDWLDSWTNTRRLSQQELAKRWALRGQMEADEPILAPTPPVVLPYGHSIYILKNGKKAYKRWMQMGCPDKMPDPSGICPVMTAYGEFLMQRKYGVWKPRDDAAPPPSP